MKSSQKATMALFLELGGSLHDWDEIGFFSREISLYNKLARNYLNHIYIFTYGNEMDLKYQKFLEPNITIIPWGKTSSKSYLINALYELVLPFRFYSIIKNCNLLKTNQNSGSIAASLSKFLFPKKKLIARSGYIGSVMGSKDLPPLARIYYFFAENITYRLCSLALISGNENYQILITKYPFLKGKLRLHNNFIDTDLFKKINLEKEFDIIYVARLNLAQKNHLAIIEACKGKSYKILFIGQGDDQKIILKAAKENNINLTLIPTVPNQELPSYYNKSSICVFPSNYEGNPKALLEAMSCELPIITYRSPGIKNVIIDNENGLYADDSTLSTRITSVLRDRPLYDKLGLSARNTILKDFSFSTISTIEASLYKELLCK